MGKIMRSYGAHFDHRNLESLYEGFNRNYICGHFNLERRYRALEFYYAIIYESMRITPRNLIIELYNFWEDKEEMRLWRYGRLCNIKSRIFFLCKGFRNTSYLPSFLSADDFIKMNKEEKYV